MLKPFLQDHSKKNQLHKSIYKYLHTNGPTSKVALRDAFQLPNATLTRILDNLEKEKIILQKGLEKSSGGRPSKLYKVHAGAGAIVGIEIARIGVHILLMDVGLHVLGEVQFALTSEYTPKVTINRIVEEIQMLLTSHQIKHLIAIGVGSVGPIDRENGVILHPEAFLAVGWQQVTIADKLKETFKVRVILENGANTAALAEHEQQGILDGSMLYCIAGYGIRCGFLQNGRLLHYRQGDASSFGHMIIQAGGRTCICGNKGCLQAYISFGAMLQQMKKNELAADMETLLQSDDPKTKQIRMEAARYFGIGLANMANLLHPDAIVLHGKLIDSQAGYLQEIIRSAKEHSFQKIHIRKGSLGAKAGSLGAAIYAFRQFF